MKEKAGGVDDGRSGWAGERDGFERVSRLGLLLGSSQISVPWSALTKSRLSFP